MASSYWRRGYNGFVSRVEETYRTKETSGEEEDRGSGGQGTERRGSVMITRGGKSCKRDVAMGLRENKGESL